MAISFGRKNSLATNKNDHGKAEEGGSLTFDWRSNTQVGSRLIDLRTPENFRLQFIPGSYNVPDLACLTAARRMGLFQARRIYLLADEEEQLQLCSASADLGDRTEIAGWFGPEALVEWKKAKPEIGSLEAIGFDTLCIRMAAWKTLVIDIYDEQDQRKLTHPDALRFGLTEIPMALDGLPADTSICLTARTISLASFSASVLWNFGFTRISYLCSGCRVHTQSNGR